MDKTDRITFELAYTLIIDIHNRDLEADMITALHVLSKQLGSYWLTNIILCPVEYSHLSGDKAPG